MTKKEFENHLKIIEDFFTSQRELNKMLHSHLVEGHSIVMFGNTLVDGYVKSLEQAFNDSGKFIEWHIFDNNFGKKNMQVGLFQKYFTIKKSSDLYKFLILINKHENEKNTTNK
jgi:hypothetical protein